MKSFKIVILDDHPIFRDGLESLIKNLDLETKIYSTGCHVEALNIIESKNIDLLLLDLEMPEISGFEFLDKLNSSNLNYIPKKVIVSVLNDLSTLMACQKRKIDGYIPKSTSRDEIQRLFARLNENEMYYTQEIQSIMFSQHAKPVNKKKGEKQLGLSEIEIKVVILNCFQYTLEEMGEILHLATGTVKTHRFNSYKKTKTKNMVGLGFYALEKGYITMSDLRSGSHERAYSRLFLPQV